MLRFLKHHAVMPCLAILCLSTQAYSQDVTSGNKPHDWMTEALRLQQENWTDPAKLLFPEPLSPPPPNLLTFVSFSMPEDSIKDLLLQTHAAGGITVIRGLVNNSLRQTALTIGRFADHGGPGFSVDPKLFAQHHIQTVPSIVLTDGPLMDKISGNISVTEALRTFAASGDTKHLAQKLLEQKPLQQKETAP